MYVFFFKQKTAYEIGTGDWSSDVCSSDLQNLEILPGLPERDVMLSTQILAGVSSVDESAGAVDRKSVV